MSNEPAPATPPGADPPPESRLPALKQGSTQKAGEQPQKGREALYSAAGTVLLIAIGVGIGLWNARQDAQEEKEEKPLVVPKFDVPALKQQLGVQTEQARVNIKKSIALSAKASTQEDCEGFRKLLASAEKLAKTAAPDLLPEVEQARRDLAAREPNLPKRADKAKKAAPGEPEQGAPLAPPPREVNR